VRSDRAINGHSERRSLKIRLRRDKSGHQPGSAGNLRPHSPSRAREEAVAASFEYRAAFDGLGNPRKTGKNPRPSRLRALGPNLDDLDGRGGPKSVQ
jgi:hypothetical protein